MKGYTFYEISKYAEDRGLPVSEKSLRRHSDNHRLIKLLVLLRLNLKLGLLLIGIIP